MASFNLTPRYIEPGLSAENSKSAVYMLHLVSRSDYAYIGSTDLGSGNVTIGEDLPRFKQHIDGILDPENEKLAYEYFREHRPQDMCVVVLAVVHGDRRREFEDIFIRCFRTVMPFGLNMRNEVQQGETASKKRRTECIQSEPFSAEKRVECSILEWTKWVVDQTGDNKYIRRYDYDFYSTWCANTNTKKFIGKSKKMFDINMSTYSKQEYFGDVGVFTCWIDGFLKRYDFKNYGNLDTRAREETVKFILSKDTFKDKETLAAHITESRSCELMIAVMSLGSCSDAFVNEINRYVEHEMKDFDKGNEYGDTILDISLNKLSGCRKHFNIPKHFIEFIQLLVKKSSLETRNESLERRCEERGNCKDCCKDFFRKMILD